MPRALEPGATFKVVLDSDKDKPADKQPAFVCRSMDGRQWRAAAKLQDELQSCRDSGQALDKIYSALALGVVGWENMIDPKTGEVIQFSTADLDRVVDPIEGGELLEKMLSGQQVSLDDKKKLGSQA